MKTQQAHRKKEGKVTSDRRILLREGEKIEKCGRKKASKKEGKITALETGRAKLRPEKQRRGARNS